MTTPRTRQVNFDRPARAPWVAPVPRTWFLRHRSWRAYMLREASAILAGLVTVDVVVGLVAVSRGEEEWAAWVGFHAHPATIVVSALVLVLALIHTVTWFAVMPKIVRIKLGGRFLAPAVMKAAAWVALVAVAGLTALWLGGVL